MEHELTTESPSKEIVVFWLISKKDSVCSACKKELGSGNFLTLDKGQGLCMECADLDHLVWLPSGDAALTRRAKKHSKLWAVVVKFSRARRRYERQGLLVEEEALAEAEKECEADQAVREARREYNAGRRLEQDTELANQMRAKLMEIFPGCAAKDAEKIAAHTSKRGSGRVGRSEAGRNLEEEALKLAAVAYIRHQFTDYDVLLMRGIPREEARGSVRDKIQTVLHKWERA
ncbi:MAG TPA: DUF2293 domain-containing protein [Candidatus Angelobacter sp.]